MNRLFAIVALLAAVASADIFGDLRAMTPENREHHTWVVLAAGSNGWMNYRHQADVCHAYQGIHKLGVPDEHIIVMMYDDIAQSSSNPTKGIIVNEIDGPDVYAGVPKSYTGRDVTAANFEKVLTGDSSAPGPVLNSTSEDNVLVYFDDHGGPGIVAFPVGEYYTDSKFKETIEKMTEKKMYKKLTLYMQACYSGSMFYQQTLPPNVYGVSSAPIQASAFVFFYDNTRNTYLASRWSYGFAHILETSPEMTLQEQFDAEWTWIKNWSQPCQYGDLSIAKQETLRSFLDADTSRAARSHRLPMHHRLHGASRRAMLVEDSVPQYMVPYELARRKFANSKSEDALSALRKEQDVMDAINKRVYSVLAAAAPKAPHLQTVPCDNCDNSCPCIQNCDESASVCKFECCDEKSCVQKNPTDDEQIRAAIRLGQAWAMKCAAKDQHDYSAVAYRHFFRAVRAKNFDVDAALKAIDTLCA